MNIGYLRHRRIGCQDKITGTIGFSLKKVKGFLQKALRSSNLSKRSIELNQVPPDHINGSPKR